MNILGADDRTIARRRPCFGALRRWLILLIFWLIWSVSLVFPNPDGLARHLFLAEDASLLELQRFNHFLFVFSKSLHLAAYFLLTVLCGWIRCPRAVRPLLLVLILVHALATECAQNFIAQRHPSWRDVGLDLLGAAVAFVLTYRWWLSEPAEVLATTPRLVAEPRGE
jgi:VanZ family protein